MASVADDGDRQHLVDYLLGRLAEEERERLDELSVADDEVAWRLQSAEHDLVDAYVRGELSGDTLERFRSIYLASAERRHKVDFAHALLTRENLAGSPRSSRRTMLLAAAAAALLALAAGALWMSDRRSNDQGNRTQTTAGANTIPHGAAGSTTPSAPTPGASQSSPVRHQRIFAFTVPAVLTRGTDQPTLSIPAGTTIVVLNLEGEARPAQPPADAIVVEVRTVDERVVWSGPGSAGGAGMLTSVHVPVERLQPNDYLVAVSTAPPRSTELWRYSFRVVERGK